MRPNPDVRFSRRAMLRAACCTCLPLSAGLFPWGAAHAAGGAKTSLTAEQALTRLRDGNRRFVADRTACELRNQARRDSLARSQAPFAVVLGCSDSRVGPEVLFDAGLGELFVVRNAGNVIDTAAQGSIEYGAGVLGAPLVVVLGHERCGAVAAAVEVATSNATFPGRIGAMIEPILPSAIAAGARPGSTSADAVAGIVDQAIALNVQRMVRLLRTQDDVLRAGLADGHVRVVGARYDLDSGTVEFLDAGPAPVASHAG